MELFTTFKEKFLRIKKDEPLKNHCTFRAGGPADFFYELFNIEEVSALITLAEENEIPYLVIGRGSNVLFRDGGFRGLVIKNLTNSLRVHEQWIMADSGVLLSAIVQKSVEAHLKGLEPLYGLPGSIGGAVYGNAGVPGTEIGQFVKTITVFSLEKGIHELEQGELEFEYRSSKLKKENKDVIMHVTLKLEAGDKERSREKIQLTDTIRRGKQPIGFTCGSFFKNPTGGPPAGKIIDECGLKGKRVGDAEINLKHGNFFMNLGNATASQIFELAEIAKKAAKEKFGVKLEEEVRIYGEEKSENS